MKSMHFKVALYAGISAGVIDITAAYLVYCSAANTFSHLLRYVASSVLGPEAYSGGPWIPVFGLGLHFLIALSWAGIFAQLWGRVSWIRKFWLAAGLVYGGLIYAIMNLVLLRFTRVHVTYSSHSVQIGLIMHALGIGLPMALVYRLAEERGKARRMPDPIAVKLAGIILLVGLASTAASETSREVSGAPRIPVLVELFTSDSCSSCPPADELLGAIDRDQPVAGAEVVALSEHVTYWDGAKWSDPNGLEAMTRRQTDYVDKLHSEPYTPQAIIDGHIQMVGSRRTELLGSIQQSTHAKKHPLSLAVVGRDERYAIVAVTSPEPIGGELIGMAAHKDVTVDVKGGENAGRTIRHVDVVYWMKQSSNWKAEAGHKYTFKVPLRGNGEARFIAVVQEGHVGRVIAIASCDLQ